VLLCDVRAVSDLDYAHTQERKRGKKGRRKMDGRGEDREEERERITLKNNLETLFTM
jgi:hypothetical protein